MSKLISLRVPDELIRRARRRRINMSQAARRGIEDAIRRSEFQDNLDWLKSHRVNPVEPSQVTIRRIRDDE